MGVAVGMVGMAVGMVRIVVGMVRIAVGMVVGRSLEGATVWGVDCMGCWWVLGGKTTMAGTTASLVGAVDMVLDLASSGERAELARESEGQ